jgi:hypothetical protein
MQEPRPWALEIERTKFKPTPRKTGTRGSFEKEESHNDGSNLFMDCFCLLVKICTSKNGKDDFHTFHVESSSILVLLL